MSDYEKQIREILEQLKPYLEAHNCFVELYEVKEKRAVMYCGGEGAVCEKKCIEEAIKQKMPDIEIVFR
jgi:Fe-S cluster biogenesis protein NfuA